VQVTANSAFQNGETLTFSGLKLLDLALCLAGSQPLELDFDGDGLKDVNDEYPLTVTVLWAGGSYDGWDAEAMADAAEVWRAQGTVISIR